jgi:cytochrome c-type biogenesis protein CcmH
MTRWCLSLVVAFAVVLGAVVLGGGPAAAALSADEMLDDPKLEDRARELGKELRCVVCQNQSIDDSNAPLAKDLRQLVRERVAAGDSNEEVLTYVTARYGDFVLLEPPVRASTWLLWYGPAALLLVGGVGAVVWLRGQRRQPRVVEPLSDEERADLDRLLKERS